MNTIMEIRGLSKTYGNAQVLRGTDFKIDKSQVISIMGPSGSGKSTFLRCTSMLEEYDAGSVYLEGMEIGYTTNERGKRQRQSDKDLAAIRRNIGFVFQNFNLFPHMTVLDNIIEGPVRVLGKDKCQAVGAADGLLQRVGLYEKREAYPGHLSGGQQQRVAIARALAMEPRIMMFDEPTSSLDPELKGEVLSVIQDLCREGMTGIIVTHEIGFAEKVSDSICMFDNGVILEQGSPEDILSNPKEARTQEFLNMVM